MTTVMAHQPSCVLDYALLCDALAVYPLHPMRILTIEVSAARYVSVLMQASVLLQAGTCRCGRAVRLRPEKSSRCAAHAPVWVHAAHLRASIAAHAARTERMQHAHATNDWTR